MHDKISRPNLIIIVTIPLLFILSSIFLGLSLRHFGENANVMAKAITLDLILTTPVIYLLLIRKTTISKLTIIPFFIIGIVLASVVLPVGNQGLLDLVKTWILPIVELIVLTIVVRKVLLVRKKYKQSRKAAPDFLTALRQSTADMLPLRVANIFTIEIGMIYFTFFHWKKAKYQSNEFSYHKESGILVILGVLLFVALVELFSVHLLLHENYKTAAWVLSIISLYGLIQLIGLMKSIPHTPIRLEENQLVVRMGIFQEAAIPYAFIDTVEITMADYPKENPDYQKITPFDHNCIIHLNSQAQMSSFFGIRKTYQHLVLSVDDAKRFKACLEDEI
jgi:hypothetical protein